MLDRSERVRYQRQLVIPELGPEGQVRLKAGRAVIVGIGGLGCVSASYLTAAGVGHIKLVDFDVVALSDLNRQVLYREGDIGHRKVTVARRSLSRLNSTVEISAVARKLTETNVDGIIDGAQVVVDGLDNEESRLVVNAACVRHRIPYVYGGVSRLSGMVTTIVPGETPCLACLLPEGTRQLGVLGITPALIASLQALEAIKVITNQRPALAGRLLLFNGQGLSFRSYDIRRNPNCPVCTT